MKMTRSNQSGFTLVELLIVVIIVGILAAVAIPLYRGATKGAYGTEADAALGMIKSQIRSVQTATVAGDFSTLVTNYPTLPVRVADVSELNLAAGDLLGTYFSSESYHITTLTNTTFLIKAQGDSSTAGGAAAVAGLTRTMDQNGTQTDGP